MNKRLILATVMLMIGIGMAKAQSTAYTYVKQSGSYVSADGTAAFDVSSTAAIMKFDDDGNGIMTIGDVTVAKLTAEEMAINATSSYANGVLAADFDNQSGNTSMAISGTNVKTDITISGQLSMTLAKTNGIDNCYATLYSPFRLKINSITPTGDGMYVYETRYDPTNHVLKCNNTTRIDAGSILNAGTTCFLKYEGAVTFSMTNDGTTAYSNKSSFTEGLSGYAVKMPLPTVETGNKIYTLGHGKTKTTEYGFFIYEGTAIYPAKGYIIAEDLSSQTEEAKFIHFDYSDDEIDAINEVNYDAKANYNGKYIKDGMIVIKKGDIIYNLNGQEVE